MASKKKRGANQQHRRIDAKSSKYFQDLTARGVFALTTAEKWWMEHYDLLMKHGYRLRSRYHPKWTPSWLKTNVNPLHCEDSYINYKKPVMDAVRERDGLVVVIKRVPPTSSEINISNFFSSPENRGRSDNHCVPIIEHIHDDEEPRADFLVMLLLRPFDDPPFYSANEVFNFIEQTLQGLNFIHENNVAHRDCSDLNIMMDAKDLYPDGFHPVRQDSLPSFEGKTKPKHRYEVPNVIYYFIDFGISVQFPSDNDRISVLGIDGLDQEPPELRSGDHIPYDPFSLDIFILGNVYKKKFVQSYRNMRFLEPLTDKMTQSDPKSRPTASEALTIFELLANGRSESSQRRPLRRKADFLTTVLLLDLGYSLKNLVPFRKTRGESKRKRRLQKTKVRNP